MVVRDPGNSMSRRTLEQPQSSESVREAVHVRRSPILDSSAVAIAYVLELPPGDPGHISDLLLRILVDIGVDTLTCRTRALIPMTQSELLTVAEGLPPAKSTLLELDLETWRSERATIDELSSRGYTWCVRLAPGEEPPERRPWLVRLDVAEATPEMLAAVDHAGTRAVITGIDDRDAQRAARNVGFEFFEGDYWRRPEDVEGARLSPSQQSLLKVMQVVYDPESSMRDVEEALRLDPGLVHRLLKILGTASAGLRQPVGSLRQGLVFLGMRCIANWTTLMLLESMSDKPEALLMAAMVRARTCEMLAGPEDDAASCFTVGLLSYFDAFLDMPLPEAIGQLPLSPMLAEAVLQHTGRMGEVLEAASVMESGKIPRGLRERQAARISEEAFRWADEVRTAN